MVGQRLIVIVPTRNEAENVRPLVARLGVALAGLNAEVLFVEDSDDETPDLVLCAAATAPLPVRLLHRSLSERTGGLGGAVQAGLATAQAR